MVIGGYFVNGCWWLLMIMLLMAIGEYYIVGYLKLFFKGYYFLL
jgi:hypothetical protein